MVTAGGPNVPQALREQLVVGGRLVIPVGPDEGSQRLLKIVRKSETQYEQEDMGPVAFVPLIGEVEDASGTDAAWSPWPPRTLSRRHST